MSGFMRSLPEQDEARAARPAVPASAAAGAGAEAKHLTPVWDFVRTYAKSNTVRFHMPGHKGRSILGCEPFDLTEIAGADSLYEADGILTESEQTAAALFGAGCTLYSTEGSSQCIRAMLFLALQNWRKHMQPAGPSAHGISESKLSQIDSASRPFPSASSRPVILAARNAHKAFLYAAALLDFDIVWLWPDEAASQDTGSATASICSCPIRTEGLAAALEALPAPPAAVYITSPDYLGGEADLSALSAVCHRFGTLFLVDNAHGAYLHFLEQPRHPLDCGADLCCDSAHKTLPVLTGGAYLHLSHAFCASFPAPSAAREAAKQALALFGSTSPSYLILSSLDCCNQMLSGAYRSRLSACISHLLKVRAALRELGLSIPASDPLHITIDAARSCPENPVRLSGTALAQGLRAHGIECEYADEDYLVLMATPENKETDFARLLDAFRAMLSAEAAEKQLKNTAQIKKAPLPHTRPEQALSVRAAIFAPHECIRAKDSLGRILSAPTVSCPPAIPIVMPGERIGQEALQLFAQYHISNVDVML